MAKIPADVQYLHGTSRPSQSIEATDDLRHPTREQLRQIVDLLSVSYDVEAGHYRGSDTDKTVAEAIGGGVLPGWVCAERVRAFGDSGENEEMLQAGPDLIALEGMVSDELKRVAQERDRCKRDSAAVLARFDAFLGGLNDMRAEIRAAQSKVNAIKAAVGAKAGRV